MFFFLRNTMPFNMRTSPSCINIFDTFLVMCHTTFLVATNSITLTRESLFYLIFYKKNWSHNLLNMHKMNFISM